MDIYSIVDNLKNDNNHGIFQIVDYRIYEKNNDYMLACSVFSVLPSCDLNIPYKVFYDKNKNAFYSYRYSNLTKEEEKDMRVGKLEKYREYFPYYDFKKAHEFGYQLLISDKYDLAFTLQGLNPAVEVKLLSDKNILAFSCAPENLQLPNDTRYDKERREFILQQKCAGINTTNIYAAQLINSDTEYFSSPQFDKCMQIAKEYGKTAPYLFQVPAIIDNSSADTNSKKINQKHTYVYSPERETYKQLKTYFQNKFKESRIREL